MFENPINILITGNLNKSDSLERMLNSSLGNIGVRSITEHDGKRALSMLEESRYDIVVADITYTKSSSLPCTDIFDRTRRFSAQPSFIFLDKNPMESAVTHFMREGLAAYGPLSYSEEQMTTAVKKVINVREKRGLLKRRTSVLLLENPRTHPDKRVQIAQRLVNQGYNAFHAANFVDMINVLRNNHVDVLAVEDRGYERSLRNIKTYFPSLQIIMNDKSGLNKADISDIVSGCYDESNLCFMAEDAIQKREKTIRCDKDSRHVGIGILGASAVGKSTISTTTKYMMPDIEILARDTSKTPDLFDVNGDEFNFHDERKIRANESEGKYSIVYTHRDGKSIVGVPRIDSLDKDYIIIVGDTHHAKEFLSKNLGGVYLLNIDATKEDVNFRMANREKGFGGMTDYKKADPAKIKNNILKYELFRHPAIFTLSNPSVHDSNLDLHIILKSYELTRVIKSFKSGFVHKYQHYILEGM